MKKQLRQLLHLDDSATEPQIIGAVAALMKRAGERQAAQDEESAAQKLIHQSCGALSPETARSVLRQRSRLVNLS